MQAGFERGQRAQIVLSRQRRAFLGVWLENNIQSLRGNGGGLQGPRKGKRPSFVSIILIHRAIFAFRAGAERELTRELFAGLSPPLRHKLKPFAV
jgi:hypothetical protein